MASGHTTADPFHPSQVATQLQVLAAVTFNIEELIQTKLPFAKHDRQRADLVVRQRGDHVRREDLRLERNVGRSLQRENRLRRQSGCLHGLTSACSTRSSSTG